MRKTFILKHTCGDRDHTAEITFSRAVKLGACRCTRYEGTRCDGSAIHALTPGCDMHADDLGEVSA